MMVCGLFCVFWLSFGLLQLPTLGLAAAYSPVGDAAAGAVSREMNAVVALYLLVWGFALGTFCKLCVWEEESEWMLTGECFRAVYDSD
jgi:uncharacterized membrane protein YdjX (TVP38/TMEM64 family)